MMYLGVMVWIGSTVTMRGITLLLQVRPETKPEPKPKISKKTETEAEPKKAKAKAEPEPKNLDEAWEKALQETKLEVKSA